MLGLLLLSLAISPVAAAVPPSADAALDALLRPAEASGDFDRMAVHPDSSTCFRIDFFQFSNGQNPRFLRESFCGPSEKMKKPLLEKPAFKPLQHNLKPDVPQPQ